MLQPHHLQITTTADGSTTLRHLEFDVLYRSDNGARGESEHVFVNGTELKSILHDWKVLELGFGTGLNFLVTATWALRCQRPLHYVALDASPIPPELAPDNTPMHPLVRAALHQCRSTQQPATIQENNISLTLYPCRWQEAELIIEPVDAVFHDPFDPNVNPDCWTKEVFSWSLRHIKPTGRLATYSAAGHIRRAMRDAGYVVARSAGFGKKREMTIASPCEAMLAPLSIKYRP